MSKILQYNLNAQLPNISIYHAEDDDVMKSIDEKVVYLDQLAKMIKGKSTIYLNEAAKMQYMDRIHNWTKSEDNIYKILLFCFSFFGFISLTIVIVLCCKYAKLNLLTMGIAAVNNLLQANAQSLTCAYEIRYTLYPVLITTTLALLILIFRVITRHYRFFKVNLSIPENFSSESQCDFFLELFDLKSCNLIYICTVKCPSCFIHLKSDPAKCHNVTIEFEHHWFYTKILINWRTLILTFKNSPTVFSLPSFTHVMFPKHFAIKRMNRGTTTARLLMSQHGYLHELLPIHMEDLNRDNIYTQTDAYQLPEFRHADRLCYHDHCSANCTLMRSIPTAPSNASIDLSSTHSLLTKDDNLFATSNAQPVACTNSSVATRSLPTPPTVERTVTKTNPMYKPPKKFSTVDARKSCHSLADCIPIDGTDASSYIYPVLPSQQFFEDGR